MFFRRFFDVQTIVSPPTSAARLKHDDTSRDIQMYTVRITGNFNLYRKNEVFYTLYVACMCMTSYIQIKGLLCSTVTVYTSKLMHPVHVTCST